MGAENKAPAGAAAMAPRSSIATPVRSHRLCAAVVVGLQLIAASATDSSADSPGFLVNFGAWDRLSPPSKSAYVAGAFDELTLSVETPDDKADMRGIVRCVKDAGLTPTMIAGLVDRRYAQHAEEWPSEPARVLVAALYTSCKTQIQDERRKGGLSP